jgi:hypothetical protein
MGLVDAFWHLLNFLLPAWVVAAITAAAAKQLWRQAFARQRWWTLTWWSALAGTASLVLGLVVSGHDGRMLTYVALAMSVAAVLWWRGFRM